MSAEQSIVGASLAKLLRDEQEKRGLNMVEMADALGMSKPYLAALLSGERPLDKLSANYLEAMAIFLRLPKAQIYNLAEILLPEDYVYKETIENNLADLHNRLKIDPSWMHLSPSDAEWSTMNMKMKLLVGYLYETASHAKIIKGITAYRFTD